MKKMISIVLALILCFALAGSVLADFTPSVTYKGVPEFTDANGTADDGCRIIGYVLHGDERIGEVHCNANGHIYATVEKIHENGCGEGHKCLLLTPLSEAETDKEIPEDSRDLLLWVYEQILSIGMKFIQCAELDAYIKEQLGEDKTVEDLVVRDLFDVTVLCQELEEYLEPEGNVVCLDFELGLEPGSFVAVVAYKNGQWQMIENVEVLEDGTVTCTTFEHFCPVAILVADEQMGAADGVGGNNGHVPASDDAPDTGVSANNSVYVWIGVAAAALVALVALYVVQRKRGAQK